MAYQPYVKVSGVWQKLTINWAEVVGGPTVLSDLSEDATSRHVSDSEKSTWNAKLDAADYASSTTGGTVKMRLSGTTLYLRNDGTDA